MNLLSVFVTCTALYLAILYRSTSLCALFLVLLLGLLWGMIQLCAAFFQLRFLFPESILNTPGKRAASFSLQAVNKGLLPIFRVKTVIQITDIRGRAIASYPLEFSLGSRASAVLPVTVSSDLCGRFLCRVRKVRIYSPFSLLSVSKKVSFSAPVLFYPEAVPIAAAVSEYTRYFPAESADSDQVLFGAPHTPMEQVRDFLPGDRLRQIHWKLSARSDEILVRDAGRPDGCPVLFFLQLLLPSGKDTALAYSRFLECAASVSFALTELRCSHYMIWYDQKEESLTRCPVRTEEDWTVFLYLLLHAPFYQEEKDLPDLYQKAYPSDTWCTYLTLSTRLQLSGNRQESLTLKPEDWQKTLTKYPLTV